MAIATTQEIVEDIRHGKMVVLVDAEDRENEGDLVMAAEFVTPETINFMAKFGRGLICMPMTEERCRQLNLPQMVANNRTPHGTAFTVSIEAASGISTGISAADRARTVRVASARHAKPEDVVMPGHIFPLAAQNGGVLVRAGHTEATIDLCELAGLTPAGVICEILKDDGEMARLPELTEFAERHHLKIGTIADLIRYRSETERLVERIADKRVTTPYGPFRLTAYHDSAAGQVHVALSRGEWTAADPTLVRVHSHVNAFDWLDIDANRHSFSINETLRILANGPGGVLVLLKNADDPEADLRRFQGEPGERRAAPWDPRLFGTAGQILKDLGVGKMRILGWPKRIPSMAGFGLEVTEYVTPDSLKQWKVV